MNRSQVDEWVDIQIDGEIYVEREVGEVDRHQRDTRRVRGLQPVREGSRALERVNSMGIEFQKSKENQTDGERKKRETEN